MSAVILMLVRYFLIPAGVAFVTAWITAYFRLREKREDWKQAREETFKTQIADAYTSLHRMETLPYDVPSVSEAAVNAAAKLMAHSSRKVSVPAKRAEACLRRRDFDGARNEYNRIIADHAR